MEWLAANWFWILIGILFIGMHLFGHGGHGGGDRPPLSDEREKDEAQDRAANRGSSGHQH